MGRVGRGAESLVPRDRPLAERLDPRRVTSPRNGEGSPARKLRGVPEDSAGDRLLLATLRIRLHAKRPWTGPFSRAHPSLTIEILNRSEINENVSVSDHWINGRPPGVWAREISEFPDVHRIDSLAEIGDGSIYRITYDNPPVVYLYRKLGLPIQFPLRIQAGYIRWEVVARRSEFDAVLHHARSVDPEFQVVSIRRRPLRSHLPFLTEAQQKLLTEAMAAGYFAVPRAITLTDLARRLDRSKSSVSEGIAIIERKLLESALRPTSLST